MSLVPPGEVFTIQEIARAAGVPLEAVRTLLARGAKPDTRTSEGMTPLIAAAMFRGSTPVLRALLDAGADPNAANRDGSTPLVQAASIADSKAMRFLIDRGSRVNQEISGENPQVMGMSPLTASAYFGTAETVQFLLNRGAAVNAPDGSGMTPLHFAVTREDQPMIAALIRAGADVNRATLPSTPASDDPGTPLMLAANTEPANASIASTLLARGARVDAVSRDRETALSRAQKRGQTAVVDALIAAGAKPESDRRAPAIAPAGNPPTDVRAAVEKSLALLQRANREFLQRAGCQSCHHAMENDVAATAISMRALQLYAPQGQKARYEQQVRKAAQWLSAFEPRTTEQRTFQLLGLMWAKADAAQRQQRAREVWSEQRPDGGWSQ